MKTALLIALAPDRRGGVPVSAELLTMDDAKAAFKKAAVSGITPVPGHPHLEIWASGSPVKTKRLSDPPAPVEKPKK
jgi:hypothetical protein